MHVFFGGLLVFRGTKIEKVLLRSKIIVMSGLDIYKEYQKKRDHSGSEIDIYASDLNNLWSHASANNELNEFYKLLEEAEITDKKLVFKENGMIDDYFMKDVIIQ